MRTVDQWNGIVRSVLYFRSGYFGDFRFFVYQVREIVF